MAIIVHTWLCRYSTKSTPAGMVDVRKQVLAPERLGEPIMQPTDGAD
jgi:hypothetical protein